MGLAVMWSILGYYIYFTSKSVFEFIFRGSGIQFINISQYWIGTSLLMYIVLFNQIRKKKSLFKQRQILIITIVIVFYLVIAITNSLSEYPVKIMDDAARYFILACVPATLCGLYAYRG